MKLHFYKYQGTGNDFIMVDDREKVFPAGDIELIAQLCDRRFGIGADGLILLQPHPDTDFYMQYFNSDGRESSMCGNGGRSIVAFAQRLKVISGKTRFMAIDGIHEATIKDAWVELKMKDVPHIDVRKDETYVLNTGSPHYVQFRHDEVTEADIVADAKKIRYNDEFKTDGINVNFANNLGPESIQMRTYERGVEDETLSCGTGVTATAIALALKNTLPGGPHNIHVQVAGGRLEVSYQFDNEHQSFSEVWLKGPAEFVFDGAVEF